MTFKKEEREFEGVNFEVYNIEYKEPGYKAGVNFHKNIDKQKNNIY